MAKKAKPQEEIAKLMSESRIVTRALKRGVQQALRRHKQAGNPVCEWRNGKVVWIQPKNIRVDPDQR